MTLIFDRMLYSIKHQTTYEFEEIPQSVIQKLHLSPISNATQKVIDWNIKIEGANLEFKSKDYHGNTIHLCKYDLISDGITISCSGIVQVENTFGVVGTDDGNLPIVLFSRPTALTAPGKKIKILCSKMGKLKRKGSSDDITLLHELSFIIRKKIQYVKGKTNIRTTAEQALELGEGVCQDHVHVFLSATRLLGFYSRYVSGYLMICDNIIQEASHAWAEVYLDGLGWVGFDISNGISPDDKYIKLATGFDYNDVIPLSGVRQGSGSERLLTNIVITEQ